MKSSELVHIWTIPACTVSEKWHRTREMWWRKLAFHFMPRQLVYWTLIRCGVRAIHDDEIVPDVTFMTVLDRTPGPR